MPAPGGPATFTIVEQTPPPMPAPPWGAAAAVTGQQYAASQYTTAQFTPPYTPATIDNTQVVTTWPTEPPPLISEVRRMSRRAEVAFAVFAALAGVTVIVGSFMPVLKLETDAPVGLPTGEFKLNDILGGTNLQVAFAIAGVALLVGAVVANLGQRFGAGLAGGAALSLVAYLGYVWGLITFISDQSVASARAVAAGGGGGTFVETTTDVGMFVLLGGTVLGLIALFIGFAFAGHDSHPPLNRAICLVGALASVAAAAGQLIPENASTFSDNFDADQSTAWITYSRVGIIAVVAIAGLVGFLRCNRWGIGFALGGIVLYSWQWISSLVGFGDQPLPPAFGNPGADLSDLKPTFVTTIGLVAMLGFGALALVLGGKQQTPPPPTAVMLPNSRQGV
jgi:hypothetical protein